MLLMTSGSPFRLKAGSGPASTATAKPGVAAAQLALPSGIKGLYRLTTAANAREGLREKKGPCEGRLGRGLALPDRTAALLELALAEEREI